ncbi:uncharacterized protein TNCV_2575241 [Trichonephila clavipes]|uniref:Uncharacterized protein n=1 Tax=Trichonephila clavipes TaxID=2585209 RepID=A0A8X6UYK3_TRICX|nr:uncharacterized protein TNCV_2575241 [Trichonephila clavipes]
MACDEEDCGFQMLNDNEIVTSVQEESDPADEETDEDEDNNNNERFQECNEDVETWMACDAKDCGFQMLNDDKIVTYVQEISNPVDDETDEDEDNNYNESSNGPSNTNTFSALETAMEWYKQQSERCPTQLTAAQENQMPCSETTEGVQQKIRDYFAQ